MKEHLLSVGKGCTGSDTEMNKTKPLSQVINSLEEKDFSTLHSKTATSLNTIGLSDSLFLQF